jgi:hypothetical protein
MMKPSDFKSFHKAYKTFFSSEILLYTFLRRWLAEHETMGNFEHDH